MFPLKVTNAFREKNIKSQLFKKNLLPQSHSLLTFADHLFNTISFINCVILFINYVKSFMNMSYCSLCDLTIVMMVVSCSKSWTLISCFNELVGRWVVQHPASSIRVEWW